MAFCVYVWSYAKGTFVEIRLEVLKWHILYTVMTGVGNGMGVSVLAVIAYFGFVYGWCYVSFILCNTLYIYIYISFLLIQMDT